MKRRAPSPDQRNSGGRRKRDQYPHSRLPIFFPTSSFTQPSLPPEPQQQQQANENIFMTDDHPNTAHKSSPNFNFNAHQSLPRRAEQKQQAIEHIVMTEDHHDIAYRPSPNFSFSAQQSLPRRAEQHQQAIEHIVMTDDHPDIAYRSNPNFSFKAHQSLPRRADQRQQHRAIEHITMTDDHPNIAYKSNPKVNFNARQQSLPRRAQQQQRQQANEEFVMIDSLPIIPYRRSQFVNPTQRSSAPRRNIYTISDTDSATGPCRHPKPILWDDLHGPHVPQSLVPPLSVKNPIAHHLPPLHDIEEIFETMVSQAMDQGLEVPLRYFAGKSIRVATMCSGTESPLLALELISQDLQKNYDVKLNIDHVFSAEIVPFKQAYIERNFHPKIIFQDMRELIGNTEATTAYGNKVPIPTGVDILVTGTSCVDFSKLNRWTKSIDDDGESGQTFFAFIDYIAQYRPAICILENVQSAPWNDIVAILTNNLQKASAKVRNAYKNTWKADDKAYAAEFAKIDTKNYYIPHTRQRGYLIAIDRRRHQDAENAVQRWAQKMIQLQRPASSPVDYFLSDDVIRRHDFSGSARYNRYSRTKQDWTVCSARNQNLRESMNIGSQRPLTRWVIGGSCSGPDHWDLGWMRVQPERTWDALDICHLRNAQRGFDDCYKTRIIEVSQNVDRDRDAHGNGVVSCLTPSGTKFITTQGRPLTGKEALRLQGIPVNKLILTHETQRELFDLAGNAMTTTVVGAVLLAALIVGHRAISVNDRPNLPENPLPIPVEEMNERELLPEQSINLTEYERCTLDKIRSEASASARLCLCEGKTLSRKRSFKKCRLCGHTACVKCVGFPKHNYCAIPELRRLEPSSFTKWLAGHLPMRLQLVHLDISGMEKLFNDCKSHLTPESKDDWTKYKRIVERALGEDMRFESTTRSRHWVVRYSAPHSYLELVIGQVPCWRFFAKPDPLWANNTRRRWLAKHPIARMQLLPGDDILAGQWEFHVPVFLQCSLKIEEFGPMTDSWESHLGIQIKAPAVKKVYNKLKISVKGSSCAHIARYTKEVVGEYQLLKDCGTASRSWHRRISHPEIPPVYFYLDSENTRAVQDDRFVFSRDHHRLLLGEARDLIGSIDPKWRQGRAVANRQADPSTTECRLYGLWEACGAQLQVFKSGLSPAYRMARRNPSIRVSPAMALASNIDTRNRPCSADTMTFASWIVPLMKPDNVCWRLGPWRRIEQESEALALRNLTWLFQKSKNLRQFPSKWRRLSLPGGSMRCQSCSPDPPSVKWRQIYFAKRTTVIPYEDERQASVFERASKAKTSAFMMQTQLHTAESGAFVGHLRVGINITALAHRVLSGIPSWAAEAVELSWRLNTAYEWPLEMKAHEFILKGNQNGVNEEFVFVERRSNIELGRLRREQCRSLWWMKQQESDETPSFLEQEVEEAYLPTLGWLAETKAKFPSQARGGILADDVGYGKTATTLALIDATRQKASDLLKTESTFANGLPSRATLIVVSGILMAQWESEIVKFLGKAYPFVKIRNLPDLSQVSVREIARTSIVLLSLQVLESLGYHQRLGTFAAMPECASMTGRPYRTWLDEAIKRSDNHVKELRSCEDIGDFKKIHEQRLLSARRNQDAAIPFRQVRVTDDQHGKIEIEVMLNDKQPIKIRMSMQLFKLTQEEKLLGMMSPPLHLFRFHRIVVDEYTYLRNLHVNAISFLRAPYRWVLSGTPNLAPNLADFADVKLLAGLLKVNLGVDHDASLTLQKSRLANVENNRTAAEKFRSYVEERSPQWHAHRVQHAQEFLSRFARKNAPDVDEIPVVEILKPVMLSWVERALVMELQQQLHTQEIGLCRGGGNKLEGHRIKRMNNFLRGSESLEEALLKACFPSIGENLADTSANPLDSMIKLREHEYQLVANELKKNFRRGLSFEVCRQPHQLQSGETQTALGEGWRQTSEDKTALCESWKQNSDDNDPDGSAHLNDLLEEAKTHVFTHHYEFDGDEWSREDMVKERRGNAAKEVDTEKNKRGRAAIENMRHISWASRQSTEKSGQVQNLGACGPESGETTDGDDTVDESTTYEDEEVESSLAPVDSWLSKIDLEDVGANGITTKMTMHIRKLRTELLARRRALRFLQAAEASHFWQCEAGPPLTCVSCSEVAEDPSCIFILGSCGHVACQSCLEERHRIEGCVLAGCSSAVGSQHIHPADCFGSTNQPEGSRGTKLDSVVACIQKIATEDQILLFVQFQTILNAVCAALQASGISYHAITEGGSDMAVRAVRDFQENESAAKKRVLILNPSNETAAGLNLANANHVMFVSPLLFETAQEFHKSRIQCIGRARRYGQSKMVHIYDFLALHTIDVDITEDRQCKHLRPEMPETGEEVWKLKSEEDLSDSEKVKNWRSGWESKHFLEE